MRCFGDGDPLYERYHDTEWGRPVLDDRGLYERLCLESFQSGLSWLIVLRKRPTLRRAFAGFRIDAVARFDVRDVDRLLADPGVIRNRAKIEAAIHNARTIVAMREVEEGFSRLLWSFRPERSGGPRHWEDIPSRSLESTSLSKALKKRGFRFVGPTTAYSLMQATGMVNDHVRACRVRDEVETLQAAISTRDG